MMYSQAAFTLSLLVAFSSVVNSQQDAPILGCEALGCPKRDGEYECTVEGTTYMAMGMVNVDTDLADGQLAFTKGLRASADADGIALTEQIWLGAPANTSFHETLDGACALGFTATNTTLVRFEGDIFRSTGTCTDAIAPACVDALLQMAAEMAADVDSAVPQKACDAMQDRLTLSPPPACAGAGLNPVGFAHELISRTWSERALSRSENGDSECWPTQPQSNRLDEMSWRGIATDRFTRELYVDTVGGITPILTVFWSTERTSKPQAQLSCVKAVDDGGQLRKFSDAHWDVDAGTQYLPSLLIVAFSVLISVFITL